MVTDLTFNDIACNVSLADTADGAQVIASVMAAYPYFTLGRMFGVRAGIVPAADYSTIMLCLPYPTIFYKSHDEPVEAANEDEPLQLQVMGVEEFDNLDLAAPFMQPNNNVLSETLAVIYASQGKYDEAIDIYMKLSLKNPEKSRYFASRIDELTMRNA